MVRRSGRLGLFDAHGPPSLEVCDIRLWSEAVHLCIVSCRLHSFVLPLPCLNSTPRLTLSANLKNSKAPNPKSQTLAPKPETQSPKPSIGQNIAADNRAEQDANRNRAADAEDEHDEEARMQLGCYLGLQSPKQNMHSACQPEEEGEVRPVQKIPAMDPFEKKAVQISGRPA